MKVPVANMNSTTMQEYVAELLNSIFDVQTRKKVHMTSVLENKPKVSFFVIGESVAVIHIKFYFLKISVLEPVGDCHSRLANKPAD